MKWVAAEAPGFCGNRMLYNRSKRTQSWLSGDFDDHVLLKSRLPNTTDNKLLGYYVCGTFEEETNRIQSNTNDDRFTAFTKMNKENFYKNCKSIRNCIEAIFGGNGNFIE